MLDLNRWHWQSSCQLMQNSGLKRVSGMLWWGPGEGNLLSPMCVGVRCHQGGDFQTLLKSKKTSRWKGGVNTQEPEIGAGPWKLWFAYEIVKGKEGHDSWSPWVSGPSALGILLSVLWGCQYLALSQHLVLSTWLKHSGSKTHFCRILLGWWAFALCRTTFTNLVSVQLTY